MLYVITSNRKYIFPDAVLKTYEILYNIHATLITELNIDPTEMKNAIRELRDLYFVRLDGEISKIKSMIIQLASRGYLPDVNRNYFEIVKNDYIEIHYIHSDTIPKLNLNLTDKGFIRIAGKYGQKLLYEAFYFEEPSMVLELFRRWFSFRDQLLKK